jgi:predicted Zn-dependent protease
MRGIFAHNNPIPGIFGGYGGSPGGNPRSFAPVPRIGRGEEAIGLLREAVGREDGLAYSEPDWFFPTWHLLGAVLINAGRVADAEMVYRDDLVRHPNNGWALYGLARSLGMRDRTAEASATQQQFDGAWKSADVTLSASAF